MGNIDMLRLAIHTLEQAGGDVEDFQERADALREKMDQVEDEAAALQMELYTAIQQAWRLE